MIVDYRNSYLINHISLHDFEFKGIKHDYEKKYIELEIKKKSAETVPSSFSFQDVLYYEMTCCKFWGSGPHIICCNLMDTTNIYDKLLRLEQVEYAKSIVKSNNSSTTFFENTRRDFLISALNSVANSLSD